MKLILIIAAALVLVPAALAKTIYGPTMWASANTNGKTFLMTIKVRSAYNKPGPGGYIKLSNCKFGQQTPLQLTNTTLPRDAQGALTWRFSKLPPRSAGPLVKVLSFAYPQGKGGPTFCVRMQMWAKGFGQYKPKELSVKLQ